MAEMVGFVPSAARGARCLKTARSDNRSESELLAERVGFEPTCRSPDKTLSRRPRYDHFGTSPCSVRRDERIFIITARVTGRHQTHDLLRDELGAELIDDL